MDINKIILYYIILSIITIYAGFIKRALQSLHQPLSERLIDLYFVIPLIILKLVWVLVVSQLNYFALSPDCILKLSWAMNMDFMYRLFCNLFISIWKLFLIEFPVSVFF